MLWHGVSSEVLLGTDECILEDFLEASSLILSS